MKEFSVLIGGRAGFGIDKASLAIASLMGQSGYRSYIYRDYPSLIRGGHTFSIIRASTEKVAAHRGQIDALLALNQETVDLHKAALKGNGIIIYDSDSVDAGTVAGIKNRIGLPLTGIIKEEKAEDIMRNACIIGAFAKSVSIGWDLLEAALRRNFPKEPDRASRSMCAASCSGSGSRKP